MITDIKSSNPKIKKSNFNSIYFTIIMLLGISAVGIVMFVNENIRWPNAIINTFLNLKTIFFEPSINSISLEKALFANLITISLSLITTIFSIIISFFIAVFAAENISGRRISGLIKAVVAIIRSIPTVLWVLIFAVSIGLGSVAAVLGCSLHSVSYLIKMYSETFEEIDYGKIEAVKATGATFWQIVFQSLLPTTLQPLTSWSFMRFEINYTVALAMGAAAGAGGIGFDLYLAGSLYYNMHEVGAITYIILFTCILLELVSRWIRRNQNKSNI